MEHPCLWASQLLLVTFNGNNMTSSIGRFVIPIVQHYYQSPKNYGYCKKNTHVKLMHLYESTQCIGDPLIIHHLLSMRFPIDDERDDGPIDHIDEDAAAVAEALVELLPIALVHHTFADA